MNIQSHNPDYKLISVVINGKELVFGQTNTGENPGLEVYHLNDGTLSGGHYYSRRYAPRQIPMLYDICAMYLAKLLKYCPEGSKMSLERSEYSELVVLFNIQPSKAA